MSNRAFWGMLAWGSSPSTGVAYDARHTAATGRPPPRRPTPPAARQRRPPSARAVGSGRRGYAARRAAPHCAAPHRAAPHRAAAPHRRRRFPWSDAPQAWAAAPWPRSAVRGKQGSDGSLASCLGAASPGFEPCVDTSQASWLMNAPPGSHSSVERSSTGAWAYASHSASPCETVALERRRCREAQRAWSHRTRLARWNTALTTTEPPPKLATTDRMSQALTATITSSACGIAAHFTRQWAHRWANTSGRHLPTI